MHRFFKSSLKVSASWRELGRSPKRVFRYKVLRIATQTAIYRNPEALWARNPQKVSKRSSQASRPGVSKKCRKGRTRKRVKKVSKSVFGAFPGTFLTLRVGRTGKTFLRLLVISGLGAVETPVLSGTGDSQRDSLPTPPERRKFYIYCRLALSEP